MAKANFSGEAEATCGSNDAVERAPISGSGGVHLGVLDIGETLEDRYLVGRFARRGGVGAIYTGVDLLTDCPVAIKVVGAGRAVGEARFEREARILAELVHPNIVRYLAHGATSRGTLYLVMEWLEGLDLSERLASGALSVVESLELVRGVAAALDVAHRRGIVHRDIKPANLFLRQGNPNDVRVLDFGIARFARPEQTLTEDGALMGTVGYMSPEQAMCQGDVDVRADVFAMGCVLYQCLTGKAPFASAHPVGVLAKVLRDEPVKATEIDRKLDPRLDALLATLLAKRREQRPESAGAVGELLDAILRTPFSHDLPRAALTARHSEQRITSIILGRPGAGQKAYVRPDELLSAETAAMFGAEVAILQGGAVMLVLTGLSEAHDRAAQAARCALHVGSRHPGLVLSVATGLAATTGDVPVGAAIDQAAAQLASHGAGAPVILLDDVTMGLIGARFDVQSIGSGNVLVAARREFEASRHLMGRPTPHVGRSHELAILDGILEECVVAGVPRTVLVTGPPGIGKTRFASEWLSRGRRSRDEHVLVARSDPGFAGSALPLLQQLLRDASALREAEPAGAQASQLRDYLDPLLTGDDRKQSAFFLCEMVGLGGDPGTSTIARAARANPDIMREQTRRAFHRWIAAELATRPIILVLEDLHWADPPSVAFILEALHENPDRPLMLIGLARPEVEQQFPELRAEATISIRLPRLTQRAAQELVSSVMETPPDDPIVARLIRTADGNPFYLEELIRRVSSGSSTWPDTVLAMIQSRIEQLDVGARKVLRAASVFGERCWDLGISEMVGSEVDTRAAFELLERSELLARVPDSRFPSAREYRFRHALLRDAVHAMMTDEERRGSHGVAGSWLERHQEKDAAVLAEHYEVAGLSERACPWLVRAARAALDVGDIDSTVQFAARGMRLGASGLDRGTLLHFRAYAEALASRPDLEVAREALEHLPVGTGQWWLAVAVFADTACMLGRGTEAAPYLELCAETPFPDEPDLAFVQGLGMMIVSSLLLGKVRTVERILRRAERSKSLQESDLALQPFMDMGHCTLRAVTAIEGEWHLEFALHGCRRSADDMSRLGTPHGECHALNYLSIAATHLGCHEEARDASRRSLEIAQRNHLRHLEDWARTFLARAYVRLGETRLALEVLEPISNSPDATVRQMVLVIIAEAKLHQGDLRGAETVLFEAVSGKSPHLIRLGARVLAKVQLALGRARTALETIEAALAFEMIDGLESSLDLLTTRAEALYAIGDVSAAVTAITVARDRVVKTAAGIADPGLRGSFMSRVEPCARAVRLFDAWTCAAP